MPSSDWNSRSRWRTLTFTCWAMNSVGSGSDRWRSISSIALRTRMSLVVRVDSGWGCGVLAGSGACSIMMRIALAARALSQWRSTR